MNQERICLECGDVLHGRADQKFCSDQCRNAWHNRQSGASSLVVRQINRVLRKNQAILELLHSSGKLSVSKSELQTLGFNFQYYTHCRTSRNGCTIYCCYGQGYMPVNGSRVKIVRPILPPGLHHPHGILQ